MNDTPIPFILAALILGLVVYSLGYWNGHAAVTLDFKKLGCEIEQTLKRTK